MGERIKDLQKIILNNKKVVIELNESQSEQGGYEIHIETDKLRMALCDEDYMKFAFAVSEAKRKLTITKDRSK